MNSCEHRKNDRTILLCVADLHDRDSFVTMVRSLRATRLAPCIQIEDARYRAEDEGFRMFPSEERVVRLLAIGVSVGSPEGQVFSGGGSIGARYGTVL